MKNQPSRLLSILVAAAMLISAPAFAHGPTNASAQSSVGVSLITGSVVVGTLASVTGAGMLIIEAVEKVGDGFVYVLKNLSTGATVSIKASGTVAGTASVGVGTAVTVIADTSGHLLMASGKAIAYIPNEIGKSLLHNKRSVERVQS